LIPGNIGFFPDRSSGQNIHRSKAIALSLQGWSDFEKTWFQKRMEGAKKYSAEVSYASEYAGKADQFLTQVEYYGLGPRLSGKNTLPHPIHHP